MNKSFAPGALTLILIFIANCVMAQTSVSGTVTEASNGETLVGVNILVKGTVLGTTTDINGNFNLEVNSNPPLTLVVSSVGFERQELQITQQNVTDLAIKLSESLLLGQEVVVSASRVEESILKSPVSIEKMDILAIQNTSSDSYYKAIANLKGVDIASSSINFQILNARGFASTGNTRFVQLIDGMDTQAPALNFPIGNLNGPSELDVESVELLPGASSALYGPNAFNGVLLINSKSPFEYQGLSAFVKTGVNHIGEDSGHPASPMYEGSLRYAKAFKNKFAFKVNGSYSRAEDWHGLTDYDRNLFLQPDGFSFNPAADKLHTMGDEASTNIGFLSFAARAAFNAEGTPSDNQTFQSLRVVFQDVEDYLDAGDVPGHTVARTPFEESTLIDYGAENIKINTGLYYRINDNLELSYLYNAGFGTSIYTGAQRYSLANFGIQQHRLQLRGSNFYVRSYATLESSGNSYITEFLGILMGTGYSSNNTWFARYTSRYLVYLQNNGLNPGDIQNLSESQQVTIQQEAHNFARQQADLARYSEGGSLFNAQRDRIFEDKNSIPVGPFFDDQSKMYHSEAQYDFSQHFNGKLEMQMGASYKIYDLRSGGTIFPDQDGGIQINELGGYVQAGKEVIPNTLKFSGSLRFDKNQNFNGQINPRISAVYTIADSHNLRASFQTGFRNPTTQGQYINLNLISARLLGGLRENYEAYNLTTNAFTGGSVLAFRSAYFDNPSAGLGSYSGLLESVDTFDPVIPEKVKSIEFGYKSLIENKLLIDASFYYNIYNNFITQIRIHKSSDDIGVNPSALTSLLSSDADNTFQIYTNLDDRVTSQGASVGLTYSLPRGYNLGGNYSWNKLIGGFTENNLAEFNTPEHKFNINFGNRKVIDNLGFNVTYRWQEAFRWESSFAIGPVPAYSTLDAQVSYRLPDLKSIIKVGGSNLFNEYYIQSLGGPSIGAIYYVSITFDELMN